MKLEDWILKEDLVWRRLFPGPNDKLKMGYETDGLHVIGTCGECKHLSESRKVCFKIMEEIEQPFGCIHFESKGEK